MGSVVEAQLEQDLARAERCGPRPGRAVVAPDLIWWATRVVELGDAADHPAPPSFTPDPCTKDLSDPLARELAAMPGGPHLAARLAQADLAGPDVSDAVRLEVVAACARLLSHYTGQQAVTIADLERDRVDEAERYAAADPVAAERGHARSFAAAEVGARLHLTPGQGRALVDRAVALTGPRRRLLDALGTGELPERRADLMLERLVLLDEDVAQRVETAVLPGAGSCCDKTLKRRLARAVLRADPDGADARAEAVHADRAVRWWVEGDGRETLQVTGSALTVAPVREAIDARARALRSRAPQGERRLRTMDQWRADAAADIAHSVLEGDHGPVARTAASRPVVHLTLPLTAAMGLSRAPGELRGHGPVPGSLSHRILADATWRRVLTDPVSGVAVQVDERSYEPSVALQRLLHARYTTCTYEGCGQPSWRSHGDHVPGWPAGTTSGASMHTPCEYHHLVRHSPLGPDVAAIAPDGTVEWVTRTGHRYRTPPLRLDGEEDSSDLGVADEDRTAPPS